MGRSVKNLVMQETREKVWLNGTEYMRLTNGEYMEVFCELPIGVAISAKAMVSLLQYAEERAAAELDSGN